MKTFKHIDNESMYPDECQHVEHSEVYRAVKHTSVLAVDDFLPWNVEYVNQKRTYKNQFEQGHYGMSLFTDMDSLLRILNKCPALNEKTNAFAKGFTTIRRGVSLKANKNHHVEYFLYDYENNSPKDDFQIIEVRD